MTGQPQVYAALERLGIHFDYYEQPEILMTPDMIEAAKRPIVRMLDMSRQLGIIK